MPDTRNTSTNDSTTIRPQTHVVLGSGPAGSALARALADRGHQVRIVSRSGGFPAYPGVESVAADLTTISPAIAATTGADVIYHAVNVPYHLQLELLPNLTTTILGAAQAHGARLVVLDTLYPYGAADGPAITEETPWAATTRKGKLRAGLDERYLEAHAAGQVRTVMGRSADFYGPGVLNSTLGGAFFPAVLTGQSALAIGDISLPHSYTYIEDVARGLAALGESDRGDGRVWHLPTVPAVPTAMIHTMVEELLGKPIAIDVLAEAIPYGPFDEQFMTEFAEMFYQYQIPQNMVSRPFERAFGLTPTSLRDGLAATLDWYRSFIQG